MQNRLKMEQGKTIDNRKKKKELFTVGTYNVETLKLDSDLIELENPFEKSNIRILGLSEIRRKKTNQL